MNTLPLPSVDAQAHSQSLQRHIVEEIAAAGGWIDFAQYMQLALYAPGLGYYSAGSKKFGKEGDFVTAPEISPLFAQTLARQAAQIVQATGGAILELGAGSGLLAAGLLLELEQMNTLPEQYFILEVSAHLRQVQRDTLLHKLPPMLNERVHWLESLPVDFVGLMLANEVLDALPVHIIQRQENGLKELGVVANGHELSWSQRALTSGHVFDLASALDIPANYTTELCPAATALIASLSDSLQKGVALFLDYGFPHREYYHAQRSEGSLMCHYRHHAHANPFLYPGLQDITAHVDFTAVAQAAIEHGTQVLGFCNQANFLINCGITDLLGRVSPQDMQAYLPLVSQAQTLLSPSEMGELFKVMALGKQIPDALLGFNQGDKRHML